MILSKLIYNTDVIGRRLLKNIGLATTDFLLAGLLTKKTLGSLQEIGLFNNKNLYFSKEELTNIEDFFTRNARAINNQTESKCGVSLLGLDTRYNDAIRVYCRINTESSNVNIANQAKKLVTNLENRVLLKDSKRVSSHFDKPGDPKVYVVIAKSVGSISRASSYEKTSALTQLSKANYHLQYGITLGLTETPTQSIIGLKPLPGVGELTTYSLGNAVLSEQLFESIDQLFKGSQSVKSLLEYRESIFVGIQQIFKSLSEGRIDTQPQGQGNFIDKLFNFSIANNQLNSTEKQQFINGFSDGFIQFLRQISLTEGISLQSPIQYPGKLFQQIIELTRLKLKFELNRLPSQKGFDLCISHSQSPSLGKLSILFKENPTDSEQCVISFHLIQDNESKHHTRSVLVKKNSISDGDDLIGFIKKQCSSGVIHSTPIASMIKAMKGWLV